MGMKGFGQRWRKWIWRCISSIHYVILINGASQSQDLFALKRGLRQGDPLSPFLFTLVVDMFSKLMARAEERNLVKGIW